MARRPRGQTRKMVYEFVRHQILNATPPTTREVQAHFGFKAVQSARQHLEALVGEGKLAKLAGKARGYRLPFGPVESGPLQLVPMLGRVQAGALTEAIEDPDGYIPAESVTTNEELFALTVRGESMKNVGILSDDTVIVRRQTEARDGDIVVAMVGDEATVKTLHIRSGRVILHPENDDFAPIVLAPGEEAWLLGKVVEVRRKL